MKLQATAKALLSVLAKKIECRLLLSCLAYAAFETDGQ